MYKISITRIERYEPNNIIIFELHTSNGIMSKDVMEVYDAFDYLNWYANKEEYRLYFSSTSNNKVYRNIKDFINKENNIEVSCVLAAVGSIKFTEVYLGKEIKAINIPKELMDNKFTRRYVEIVNKSELERLIVSYKELFIKETHRTKKFEPLIYRENTIYKENIPNEILVSEVVEFVAEYRAFVYRGEIIDCRQYFGSYKENYDKDILEEMVKQWETSPTAYTLDIGVLDTGETVIIEAHTFLSCGLYGFNSSKIALMTLCGFKEEKSNGITGIETK